MRGQVTSTPPTATAGGKAARAGSCQGDARRHSACANPARGMGDAEGELGSHPDRLRPMSHLGAAILRGLAGDDRVGAERTASRTKRDRHSCWKLDFIRRIRAWVNRDRGFSRKRQGIRGTAPCGPGPRSPTCLRSIERGRLRPHSPGYWRCLGLRTPSSRPPARGAADGGEA